MLTGCNEAFLVDQATRDRLVAADPRSAEILRPYLRGQDIVRWHPCWRGLWMIVLKSSGDHSWTWSEAADELVAEATFADSYPALHRHMKGFEDRLRTRQDQGRFWWELRSCSYYGVIEAPKTLYQEIQFFPAYGADMSGLFCNNKVFILPGVDWWLLAALNSPLMWWHNWRYLVHLKDEALSPQGVKMESLPVAPPPAEARSEAEDAAARLVELTRDRQGRAHDLADWLRVELGLERLPMALRSPFDLDEEGWVTAIRGARGRSRPLSVAALRATRDEYHASVAPVRALQPEVLRLERRLAVLVNAAYGLSPADVDLLWRTAPPPMPVGDSPDER